MKQVSRRDVGRLVAGLAAARALPLRGRPQGAPARAAYVGALTGVDPAAIEGRHFDPVAYTRELYAGLPAPVAVSGADASAGGGVAERSSAPG